MKLREFIKKNQALAGVVAAVIALITVGYSAYSLLHAGSPPTVAAGMVWYYDLNTGKLFEALDQIPPIAAPGSAKDATPTGVHAYMFSCGSCADDATRFVGWLETYTPEARKQAAQFVAPPIDTAPDARSLFLSSRIDKGVMVKIADEKEWVDFNSQHGADIMAAIRNSCGAGVQPTRCPGPVHH